MTPSAPSPPRRRLLLRTLPGLAASLAGGALAQTSGDDALTLYTSAPAEDHQAMVEAFHARTRQRVVVWRASSEQVAQRVVTETRAGRQAFDLVETNASALEPMRQAEALAPLSGLAGFSPARALLPAHGHWLALRLSVLACAWNSDRVAAAELPQSYDDLIHPRWSGRIALEVDDHAWFATLHQALGANKAGAWFEQLAALRPQLRKGHSLIANLIAAGEVHLSLNVYSYRAAQLQATGAPIRHRLLAPAAANVVGSAVARHSRYAAAAARWMTFVQEEGQTVLRRRQHVAAADTLTGNACCSVAEPLVLIDPAVAAGGGAWRQAWQQFNRRAAARPS